MKFIKEVKSYNSFYQILETLSDFQYLTENEIFKLTFEYDRNTSIRSNKKYADMLRRILAKKLIARIDNRIVVCRNNIGKARFVYVLTKAGQAELGYK